MIVFPEEDGPNSLERSTLIVSIFPSTVISTFFMVASPLLPFVAPEYNGIGGMRQGRGLVVLGIEMFHGKGWGTGVPGAFGHSWARTLPSASVFDIRFLGSSAQVKISKGFGKFSSVSVDFAPRAHKATPPVSSSCVIFLVLVLPLPCTPVWGRQF
jgi:hypothetical protein